MLFSFNIYAVFGKTSKKMEAKGMPMPHGINTL